MTVNESEQNVDVFLALGSNLDNPVQQIKTAIKSLRKLPNSQWQSVSSLYQSAPMGPQNQPDYINAVARLTTKLDAYELLALTMQIEQNQGRQRGQHWGARTLDIDLLLYGSQCINSEKLTIPHPGMHTRNFVLLPLAELVAEDFEIPGLGRLDLYLLKSGDDGISRLSS